MMTIGTMPRVSLSLFRPQRRFFSRAAGPLFWGLVVATAVGVEYTVGRLNGLLRAHTHRSNDGELLWRNQCDESEALRAIALVTNDVTRSPQRVVGDYLRRWWIEMLIKIEKQNLGLGAYRVLRYRAVVRHLHLVDCTYACLIHVGLEAQRAQGRKNAKSVLRLPPIRQLKQELRQQVWDDAVKRVAKVTHDRTVIRRLEKLLVA